MRSTGEVMGLADSFGMAFAKAQIAADGSLPLAGGIFVTVNDSDKPTVLPIARRFHELGFRLTATEGTARYLRARGVPAERVAKVHEGRPNAIDLIVSGEIHLLINTPLGKFTQADDYAIRRTALVHRVPYTTTMSAASAACDAIIALRSRIGSVRSLQEWHARTSIGKPTWEAARAAPSPGPRVVIRIGKGLDRFEMKGAIAIVGAGMPTPILARRTAEAGFAGVERFIGIPGTVGGGVYMNAGAHGAEFAEVVTEVTVMDGKGKIRQLARKQISFKYRASNLGDGVVLETKLLLLEEAPAKLKELQGKLLRWRKAGTPFDQPCAGSVFKNPGGAKTAGMLVDECGLKGYTIGGAQVSTMHANYFVNTGTATPSDVLRLIEHVRKTVQKKTGVELELEVKVIG